MKQFSNNYDLEEKTAKFGENIMEANAASSKKDFQNKIRFLFVRKKPKKQSIG